MKALWSAAAAVLSATAALAETDSFDRAATGSLPPDWTCGVTGQGSPKWTIEADSSAPSGANVLKQSGSGTFPWCVKKGVSIADGYVEVRFKPIAGRVDQAGGVVWRWKDGDNYYVARANALEDNLELYYTTNGRRISVKSVDTPVAANRWHILRVAFSTKSIDVSLEGKSYIKLDDTHISGPGAVGIWTKADSVTAFDDFSFDGK